MTFKTVAGCRRPVGQKPGRCRRQTRWSPRRPRRPRRVPGDEPMSPHRAELIKPRRWRADVPPNSTLVASERGRVAPNPYVRAWQKRQADAGILAALAQSDQSRSTGPAHGAQTRPVANTKQHRGGRRRALARHAPGLGPVRES